MRSTRLGRSRATSGRAVGSSSACQGAETRTWTASKSPRSQRTRDPSRGEGREAARRDFAGTPVKMMAERTKLATALKANGDLKLVAYMMAGHPNKKRSIE